MAAIALFRWLSLAAVWVLLRLVLLREEWVGGGDWSDEIGSLNTDTLNLFPIMMGRGIGGNDGRVRTFHSLIVPLDVILLAREEELRFWTHFVPVLYILLELLHSVGVSQCVERILTISHRRRDVSNHDRFAVSNE